MNMVGVRAGVRDWVRVRVRFRFGVRNINRDMGMGLV